MKLTALEIADIAQILHDSTALADRSDAPVFTHRRERRCELANRVRTLLNTVDVECAQGKKDE